MTGRTGSEPSPTWVGSGGSQVLICGRNYFRGAGKAGDEAAFAATVAAVEEAIAAGVQPQLITAGSSGSYFARDKTGRKVAVFKPKDEEPFAELNPKWPKFFQRLLCPCAFGRRCLLANQGYLSEAGASLVDDLLGLGIVPKTKVVSLASPTFYYARRAKQRPQLPPKMGSFQMFVHDAEDADPVLTRLGYGRQPATAAPPTLAFANTAVRDAFHAQVRNMIALDYIIRNTDRSGANWMIRVELDSSAPTQDEEAAPTKPPATPTAVRPSLVSDLTVAVIDNGLAFPFKHPEHFRTYPFYWSTLEPFCDEAWEPAAAASLLARLRDPGFVVGLGEKLERVFKADPAFRKLLFQRQLAVLRGQVWNLAEALERGLTPRALAALPPRLVTPRRLSPFLSPQAKAALSLAQRFKARPVDTRPCFKNC